MKGKKINLIFTFALVASVFLASCSKKMEPLTSDLFSVEPSTLELVGKTVPATVNGRFPAKWFDKKAVVTVTPVLKYAGGEVLGVPQTFQGEKVNSNGVTINKENGGAMVLRSSFEYIPEMKKSELHLRFNIVRKGKELTGFPDLKVADGVIATAALADARTVGAAGAADAFQRIIKEAHDADILFLIQRAELRSSELNSSNIAAWKELVKEAEANERKNLEIEVAAYASPDGGYKLNDKLAEQREKNTSNFLKKDFKKNKVAADVNAKYTAQDWDGFQKLVQASSLQDKDLVLRVLSMYPDPERREREIKNISAVYSELAETILPKLRRSRLIANVEVVGKSDQELKDMANGGQLNELNLEELLYAGTLDGVQKEAIYTQVTNKYANDYRGWNNLGSTYFEKGDLNKAKQAFTKANQLSARSAEPNMNLGLIALTEGDTKTAEQLFGKSAGASSLNESLGVLYLNKGDYNKAVQSFGEAKSNNAAIAQIVTKNYNKAQQTLNAVPSKDATTYYLSAVVAARTNNLSGVANNLKTAISKGASKVEIAKDLEFAKFLASPEVASLLN